MPSLEALAGSSAIDAFAKKVAADAQALRIETVEVNGGIQTTEALNAHLMKGRDIPFDYQRLGRCQ
jgi:hypothetical protein